MKIKELRIRKGLTKRAIAKEFDLSYEAVSLLERDYYGNISMAKKIKEWLSSLPGLESKIPVKLYGDNLRKLREEQKISQTYLANTIGITQGALSGMELYNYGLVELREKIYDYLKSGVDRFKEHTMIKLSPARCVIEGNYMYIKRDDNLILTVGKSRMNQFLDDQNEFNYERSKRA